MVYWLINSVSFFSGWISSSLDDNALVWVDNLVEVEAVAWPGFQKRGLLHLRPKFLTSKKVFVSTFKCFAEVWWVLDLRLPYPLNTHRFRTNHTTGPGTNKGPYPSPHSGYANGSAASRISPCLTVWLWPCMCHVTTGWVQNLSCDHCFYVLHGSLIHLVWSWCQY